MTDEKKVIGQGPERPDQPVGRRVIKIFSRVFLYTTAFLVVLFLGLFILLQTRMARDTVQGFLTEAIEKNLDVQFQIGKISGNLLFQLSLEQVRLSGKKGPILAADRITVNYFGPMVLLKVLVVHEMEIEGLSLNLIKAADGAWNIAAFITKSAEKTSAEKRLLPVNIFLHRVSLRRSNVMVADQTNQETQTRYFKDVRFAAGIKLTPGPMITAQVLEMAFTLDRPDVVLVNLRGSIAFDSAQGLVFLRRVRIRSQASDCTLNGTLMLNPEEPQMDVTATFHTLSLPELGRWVSIGSLDRATVSGSLHAKGTMSRFYHRLDLQLGGQSLQTKGYVRIAGAAGVDLEMSGSVRNLNLATLPQLRVPWMTGNLNADIEVTGTHFTRPGQKGRAILHVKDSQLLGYELTEGKIRMEIDRSRVTLEHGQVKTPLGLLTIRGAFTGILDPAAPKTLRMEASVQEVDLAGLIRRPDIAGKVSLEVNADVSLPPSSKLPMDFTAMSARIIGRINPSSVWGVQINQGRLEAEWANRELIIKTLDFSTGAGRLILSGSILPFQQKNSLTARVSLPDLKKAAPLIFRLVPQLPHTDSLKGALEISGRLDGEWSRPSITADVIGTDFYYDTVSAGTLKLTGAWNGAPENFNSTINMGLHHLTIQDREFSRLNVRAKLSPVTVLADVSIKDEKGLEAVLSGEVEDWLQQTKTITVRSLTAVIPAAFQNRKADARIRNQGPVRLTVSRNVVDILSFHLVSDDAAVSVVGRITPGKSQTIRLSLKNVDIDRMLSFRQGEHRINGLVSTDVNISGTASAPIIDVQMNVKGGSGYGFSFSGLDVQMKYQKSNAQIQAVLYQEKGKVLDVNGDVGMFLSFQPVTVKLLGSGLDVSLKARDLRASALPIPKSSELTWDAVLDLTAHVSGTVAAPALTGELVLRDGFLSIKDPALTYEELNGKIRFSSDKIFIDRIIVKGDKEGTLSGAGEVAVKGLSPVSLSLLLTGENFYVPFHRAIYARIQPNLMITGQWTAPRVTGTLMVSEGRILLDRLSEQGPAEIQIVNGKPDSKGEYRIEEPDARAMAFVTPLAADVEIKISKNTWAKGQNVNAELAGRIQVKKDPGKPFVLLGGLNTVRGSYTFQGKVFKATQGSVSFTGAEDLDPRLDIRAVTRVKRAVIMIHITGTASQINLALDSDPKMDQADIISYLVFGQPTSALKRQQAFNAEKAALSITGKVAASELKNILGGVIPLDTFSVDTGEDDIRKGSVSVGKYVAPDVFVTYRKGFTAEGLQQFEVTYEITRNLSVETQVGDEKTDGIDLFWQHDF